MKAGGGVCGRPACRSRASKFRPPPKACLPVGVLLSLGPDFSLAGEGGWEPSLPSPSPRPMPPIERGMMTNYVGEGGGR